MASRARMIIPGAPHHVTQRGNRRERIFLAPGDEAICLDLMSARLERHGVACWAYCLMPNHVYFILAPRDETGLARAVGEAHRRDTTFVGARGRWSAPPPRGERASLTRPTTSNMLTTPMGTKPRFAGATAM